MVVVQHGNIAACVGNGIVAVQPQVLEPIAFAQSQSGDWAFTFLIRQENAATISK